MVFRWRGKSRWEKSLRFMASLLLLLLLVGPPAIAANAVGINSPHGGLACDTTLMPGIDAGFPLLDLAGDAAVYRGDRKTTPLGLGSGSAAGRGKGQRLRIATQNTQGLSEEKLAWLVEQQLDVIALTENHGDLADSRLAA